MSEQLPPTDTDDTEGHGGRYYGDAERDEVDDTEGHGIHHPGADAERDEADDTEGHGGRYYGDTERDEGHDAEGHMPRVRFGDAESADPYADGQLPRTRFGAEHRQDADDAVEAAGAADDEDVAGHVSPRPTGAHDLVTDAAEGRRFPAGGKFPAGGDGDEDDVAGHGLGPLDPKRA